MSPSRAYAREPEATGAGRGWTGGFAGMPSEVSERTRTIPIASARMTPRAPARICRFRSLRSRRPSSRSKSPRSRSTVRLSRSRTSAILGIVDLHHLSERVAPVARQGTDRRVRDAERISRLLRRKPEHLGQHERRSLPRREGREDVPGSLPGVRVGEVVAGRREEPGGSTRLAVLTPPDPSRKRSPTRTDLRRLGT